MSCRVCVLHRRIGSACRGRGKIPEGPRFENLHKVCAEREYTTINADNCCCFNFFHLILISLYAVLGRRSAFGGVCSVFVGAKAVLRRLEVVEGGK